MLPFGLSFDDVTFWNPNTCFWYRCISNMINCIVWVISLQGNGPLFDNNSLIIRNSNSSNGLPPANGRPAILMLSTMGKDALRWSQLAMLSPVQIGPKQTKLIPLPVTYSLRIHYQHLNPCLHINLINKCHNHFGIHNYFVLPNLWLPA